MNVASLFSARSAPRKLNEVIILTKPSPAQSGCPYSYTIVICYFTVTIDLNKRLKCFILPQTINITHIAPPFINSTPPRLIS